MSTSSSSDIAAFRYLAGRGVVPTTVAREEVPHHLPLRVNVLFTGAKATSVSLKRAVELAIDLDAETRIVVPQIIPYPMALEYPVVSLEHICSQLIQLAGSAGADPYIDIYFCRDEMTLLRALFH